MIYRKYIVRMELKRKKKAVVTGGAGFIGSHLARALIDAGYEVVVVDNLAGGKRENIPTGAAFHEVDVRDTQALCRLFSGAQVVFHLAALPRVQFSIEHPQETHDVNVSGTLSVLCAAHDSDVRRVVYSASSSAYGDQAVMPLIEEMPANPKSPYGLHKYMGELKCRLFSELYGLETISLRYFNVYGPGMDPDGPYALVTGKFLKQRAEGKPMTIVGDGTQTRDFTHVRDIVRANILAAESPKVGRGEVVNIGSGKNLSVKRIAELIGGSVEYLPPRIEPHDSLADITRAKELLGWEPTIPFEEGVTELKRLAGVIS